MSENYIFWIVAVIITYLMLSKIAKMYKIASHGNSIRLEEDMTLHIILEIVFGLALIIVIWVTGKVGDSQLNVVIFYCLSVLIGLSVLHFIYSIMKEIKEYAQYRKTSSFWVLILVLFSQNVVWLYLFYNYYILRVAGNL